MKYLLPALLCLVVGCGPIKSTAGIVEAERALRDARDAGAAEKASYPLTLAEGLLEKAREEQGYGEWFTSMNLANEARDLAQTASQVATTTEGWQSPLKELGLDAPGGALEDDADIEANQGLNEADQQMADEELQVQSGEGAAPAAGSEADGAAPAAGTGSDGAAPAAGTESDGAAPAEGEASEAAEPAASEPTPDPTPEPAAP